VLRCPRTHGGRESGPGSGVGSRLTGFRCPFRGVSGLDARRRAGRASGVSARRSAISRGEGGREAGCADGWEANREIVTLAGRAWFLRRVGAVVLLVNGLFGSGGLEVSPRPASSLPETHAVCEDRLAGPCVFRDGKAGSWVAGSRLADGCDGDDDGEQPDDRCGDGRGGAPADGECCPARGCAERGGDVNPGAVEANGYGR
jgi:hypothetical protein